LQSAHPLAKSLEKPNAGVGFVPGSYSFADQELARVVNAWPTLPAPIRRAVLALITAGDGESR
jgi:hypothetical protein